MLLFLHDDKFVFCAGLLIYNGVVNLLVPLFDLKLLRKKWHFQVMTYCTLCAGYVSMAFLAKYA